MKTHFFRRTLSALLLAWISLSAQAQMVLVETESFQKPGGWVVDQQFMDEMGSPYLLAHGLGTPVADASTKVTLPSAGKYQVWVRTRDWVAPWKVAGAPGKFQISINAQKTDTIFGTKTANWAWQNGGTIEINNPDAEIKLCDLTGFEGRCDAIVLTKDLNFAPPNDAKALATWRSNLLGNTVPKNAGQYDLVVVGGGMAGIAASIAAARLGLKVALVQDRPVVGGNNSTEVRVGLGGSIKVAPFVNLGNVIAELMVPPVAGYPAGNGHDSVFNDKIRMDILKAEKNITLFMNYRADAVTVESKMIKSVLAQNTLTAERMEFFGTYFSDCTGDGTIGNLAGADFEMNPTAHMGNSNLWNLKEYDTPQPFQHCPWALDLTDKPFPGRPGINGAYNANDIDALGEWFWESGFSHNPITEVEYIRDYNFRAMYGAWDCVKNTDKIYPNYRLNWAAYVTGKRESRRLLGDIVLTKEDMLGNVMFPDGLVAIGWNMDVHIPNVNYQKSFEGEEFISHDVQTPVKRPFYIPYRCLYSRNIGNLFMAGRNISVTQDALGAVRVMKTTGMMGEVVGLAAALCKTHNVMPRDLYTTYLKELTDYVTRGVPAKGQSMNTSPIIAPDSKNIQIIIDNTDQGCTFDAPWAASVYEPGYYGANYVHDGSTAADPAKWAKWTPNFPSAAPYRVFMKWTSGSGRPAKVPVEIVHAEGISQTTINQTTNGGIWNYIETYKFNAGTLGYVKISAAAAGSTIADAVLFEKSSISDDENGLAAEKTTGFTICSGISGAVVVLDLMSDARVSLTVFSMLGRMVQTLVSEQFMTANSYSYPIDKARLAGGIYLIKLLIDGKPFDCKKLFI